MKRDLVLEIVRDSTSYTIQVDSLNGILGRGPDADIRLPFPTISSAHLEFKKENELFFFRDLGTTNGTSIEGVKVEPRRWIEIKDPVTLTIVDTRLIFSVHTEHKSHFTMTQSGTLARKLLMDALGSKDSEGQENAFLEALSGSGKGERLTLDDGMDRIEIGGMRTNLGFPPGTPHGIAFIFRDGDGFSIKSNEAISMRGRVAKYTQERLRDGDELVMREIRFLFRDPLEAYFSEIDDSLHVSYVAEPSPLVTPGDTSKELSAPKPIQGSTNLVHEKSKSGKDSILIVVVLIVVVIAIVAIIGVLSL